MSDGSSSVLKHDETTPIVSQLDDGEGDPEELLDRELDRIPFGRFHWFALATLGLANAADSAEIMVISYILDESPHFPDSLKGVLSMAVFVGMLIGSLVSGSYSDMIGRKPCLVTTLLVNIVFGCVMIIFPNTWWWIFLCRVMAGVGVGGSVPAMFTMAAELTSSRQRGKFITGVCTCWMFGGLYVSGAGWLMIDVLHLHWIWLCLVAQAPNVLALLFLVTGMPETPKFYATHNQPEKAQGVLTYIAKRNGRSMPHNTHPAPVIAWTLSRPEDPWKLTMQRVHNLFRLHRTTTALLLVMWFGLSFGWYGIILWIPRLFKEYHLGLGPAFLVQVANLPGNLASTALVDRLGRKRLVYMSMGASCVLCLAMGLAASGTYILIGAMTYSAVSIMGWNSLSCLSSESFPTDLRSTAMGILSGTGRISTALSQVVFGLIFGAHVGTAPILFVAAATMLMGCIAGFFLPYEPAEAAWEV